MPQISDLVEKKKFVKKTYRPWDLSGTGTLDTTHNDGIKTVEPPVSTVVTNEIPIVVQQALPGKEDIIIEEPVTLTPVNAIEVTDNITDNTQITTKEQPDNNSITMPKQPDIIEITPRQQLGNYQDNNTGNVDSVRYLTDAIKKLTGIQKNLFLYIIQVCSARGALDTGNIMSSDLAHAANCSPGSAKTSLNRLIDKHVVIRHEGKACKGGYMVLGITSEIQAAALQAQQSLFNPFKSRHPDNKTDNTLGNNSSYSSSSLNINKTTTSLPDEWESIDFEPLQKIGFSETQLKQLFESKSTAPEIVQESIYHFAFSLEHSAKVKAYPAPLNIFMGVLRKGNMWNEPSYVSPKELALRQILDEKRKKKEEFDAMIKELVDLEFPEWRKKLSEEQVKQIVPVDTLRMNLTPAITAALRSHFVEKEIMPRL